MTCKNRLEQAFDAEEQKSTIGVISDETRWTY